MIRRAAGVALLVVAFAVAPAPVAAGQSSGGLPGFCPDANGVTVAVDFNELGGGVVVRCAVGAQANGLAALENAGFSVTGTQRWGKGFVCRIQGKPGPDTEPCLNTPPASAYWSYWHATNGGSWQYSNFGLLSRTPPPGSFDGWSFAKDKVSSSVPPPGITPRRPVTTPPTTPAPPPPGSGTKPAAPATTAPATAAPDATTTPAAASPSPDATPSASASGWTENLAEPPLSQSSNTPTGVIAAAVLVAILSLTAWWVRRRRKNITP